MPCSKRSVSIAGLKSDFLINTKRELFYDPYRTIRVAIIGALNMRHFNLHPNGCYGYSIDRICENLPNCNFNNDALAAILH